MVTKLALQSILEKIPKIVENNKHKKEALRKSKNIRTAKLMKDKITSQKEDYNVNQCASFNNSEY